MSWLLLLGPLVAVVVYWIYWRWTHRRMLALAAKVPGPHALPILGNALLFLTEPDEQLNKLTELSRKYGDYMRIWLGPDLNILVKDPADIRVKYVPYKTYLLTSNKVNEKGPLYDLMKTYIGPGILTGGRTWRAHRKIATPAYNKRSVEEYSAVFNREAEELARLLARKEPHTIDVYEDVVKTTTQCVCQTLMGLSKEDSQSLRRLDEIISITPRMYDHVFKRMMRWWLQIPLVYWLLGEKAIENKFVKAIDEFTSDIVNKKRKQLITEGTAHTLRGIVDTYLISGELNEKEIKWETFSLFTTSQEASAKIAAGVLMFLAHLPDWQEKVYTEIMSVVGPEGPVSGEHLKRLPLLDMVYKETLRYFAIAPLIQRTVTDEITIHDGAITLPAGTSLVIPIHELHRDPRHWPDPFKVMPERFLPENVQGRDPNAFVPFSLGAMDCLGRVYATSLIKTLVVHVLRRVELQGAMSLDHLKLDIAISVRSADGYLLRVKPRAQYNSIAST